MTFDDGPHYTVTPRILDILQKNNARATFFVLGNRVDNFPNIIQREYSQGHEIGSHSFSHPQITTLTSEEIEYQFTETEHRIQQYVPYTTKLIRPPYGQITQSLKEVLQKTFVLWSIDTQDWKTRDKDAIVSEVLNNVKDGDIILMHDMYSTTADACEELIPALIERGYQLVTVSELLKCKRNYACSRQCIQQSIINRECSIVRRIFYESSCRQKRMYCLRTLRSNLS